MLELGKKLEVIYPELSHYQKARIWRNQCPDSTTEGNIITEEEQKKYYEKRKANVFQNDRAILLHDEMIGFISLTATRQEEIIGLIIDPAFRKKGYGTIILNHLLEYKFEMVNSKKKMMGKCMRKNKGGMKFWEKFLKRSGYEYKIEHDFNCIRFTIFPIKK